VATTERGEGGEVGCLDEGIGGDLGDEAGDARAVVGEDAFEGGEVEDVAEVDVVDGGGREFLQDRDGIEVEPAELEPNRAAAGGLEGGGGAPRGPDGVHAVGREEEVGVGGAGQDAAQVAADLGGGRGGVAGEGGLGERRGEQAEADEVILGLARGEEAAEILEENFGASEDGGRLGVRDAGETVVREDRRSGGSVERRQVGGERGGHRRGGDQPEGAPVQFGPGGDEVGGELFGERMDDEAGIAGGEVADGVGVSLLVAADIPHGGQTARNGVRTAGNALAERKVREGGHAEGKADARESAERWKTEGERVGRGAGWQGADVSGVSSGGRVSGCGR